MPNQTESLQAVSSFEDRRETPRISLRVPIEISGNEQRGRTFSERTETIDVNLGGCKFHSTHALQQGELITIRRVERDGQPASNAVLFEIVWAGEGEWGWIVGAAKREFENIWPLSFPKKAATQLT